jgi:hypothetical protein
MIDEKKFTGFYSTVIDPALDALEPQRIFLKKMFILCWISLGIGILFFIILCGIHSHPSYLFIPVLAGLGGAGAFYKRVLDKSPVYVSSFKQKVISTTISLISRDLAYYPEGKISESLYDESDLYPQGYDIYQGEDCVEGKIDKTSTVFSELNVMRRRNQIENSDMTVVFNGLFFAADFNKNFTARTYVWDRDQKAFNFLNKNEFPFATDLGKVLLENPAFSSRFVVYSTDQVEARYILSPSLMERLVSLSGKWHRNISFSFVDSKIFVAIPIRYGTKLFEPEILSRPKKETIEWFYELLKMLAGIVDELNLNLRIWNKV